MANQKPRRLTSTALSLMLVLSVLVVMNFVSINVRASGTEYHDWSGDIYNTTDDTYPHLGYDSAVINITDGDLIICDGVTLTFNDNVELVIKNTVDPGEYGIQVNATAKFVIDSDLSSTKITTAAPPYKENTYWFTNSGTIDFLGATVERVYGDPENKDTTGGIRNNPGSVCNLSNCDLINADTHSLYAEGNSTDCLELNIDNIKITNTNGNILNGTGIWIKGNDNADVMIEGVIVSNTSNDGIRLADISSATLANSTITNCLESGIFVMDSDNTTIYGNQVYNISCSGVYISSSVYNIIKNNSVAFSSNAGIYLNEGSHFSNISYNSVYEISDSGIQIGDERGGANNNHIYNNTVNNTDYWGIFLDNSLYNEVYNNTAFSNDEFGIYLKYSDNNTIHNNTAYDNNYGICIRFYSHDNVVINNKLERNTRFGDTKYAAGVAIEENAYSNIVESNYIANNSLSSLCNGIKMGWGMYFWEAHDNIIQNNTIFQNYYGFNLINASNNTIYHNNIINNTIQARDQLGFGNFWNASYPSGGNYWNDYEGTDQYCGEDQDVIGPDFIGDDPYDLIGYPSDPTDHYPLMNPWPCNTRSPRDVIRINDYTEFTSSRGVTSGNGTASNPYVIENYVINATGDGCGIYIGNTSKYFEIRNCYIHNSSGYDANGYYLAAGININNATNGSIDKNVLIDNYGYGVVFNTACNNSISNCEISSNGEGIRLDWYSCNNSIENNTVQSNGWGGYILQESNYNTFIQNNISSNDDYGIKIEDDSCNNTISYNDFASNGDYGVAITYSDCENNTIHHNNLYNNNNGSTQGYDIGVNNTWDNGYPSGGNYWSDYNGTDIYGGVGQNLSGNDGIGDSNYSIDGGTSVDRYPLMEPNMQQYAYWAKSYGGSSYEYARDIESTSDGGSVVAGYTYSFGNSTEFWVLKLNATGDIEWEKTYGSSVADSAYSIDQTYDGGYIVAGASYINGASDADYLILKLDADGNIVWNKTYDNSTSDVPYSIQETEDLGYIVAGRKNTAGASSDAWILKLDEEGNVSWSNSYGGTGSDIPYSIYETYDNGFVFAGQTNSDGAGNYDYWVVNINSTGALKWNKTYGGSGVDFAYSIQETTDKGFIVAGQTSSYGNGSADYWVIKLDENGTIEWENTYGNTTADSAYPIQQTSDGGYIVGGTTYSSVGAGNYDAWLIKLNETGSIEWQKTYGGTIYDRLYALSETTDGQYIVAGYTSSFGAGNNDFWVMDLGYEGQITFDYDSGAYVNTSQEVPAATNCDADNISITVTPITDITPSTPIVNTQDTKCTVEIQATPSYGWY